MTHQVINGPALWDKMLESIRPIFPSAIIAGGAVRDFMLSHPPRDFDIFVNADDATLMDGLRRLPGKWVVEPLAPDLTEYENNPDWEHEVSGVLDGVFVASEFGGTFPVQIIGRPMSDFGGHALTARFDLGITRCWYDGLLRDTPEALADRLGATLTLMRWDTDAHVTATMARVHRFRSTRPQFHFVDPRDSTQGEP